MFGYQAHLPVDHQGADGVVSPTSDTWLSSHAGLPLRSDGTTHI
jgi:hypothetical protein